MKYEFSQRVFKTLISNFMKISPVEAEFFHAYRRIDGTTDMTNLIVAFRILWSRQIAHNAF